MIRNKRNMLALLYINQLNHAIIVMHTTYICVENFISYCSTKAAVDCCVDRYFTATLISWQGWLREISEPLYQSRLSLPFACSIFSLASESIDRHYPRHPQLSLSITFPSYFRMKNSPLHSSYSLTCQSDERTRWMQRRILHPDTLPITAILRNRGTRKNMRCLFCAKFCWC